MRINIYIIWIKTVSFQRRSKMNEKEKEAMEELKKQLRLTINIDDITTRYIELKQEK